MWTSSACWPSARCLGDRRLQGQGLEDNVPTNSAAQHVAALLLEQQQQHSPVSSRNIEFIMYQLVSQPSAGGLAAQAQ